MGWGIILKMIRDKNVTWGTRVETVTGRTGREHWALQGFDALEWKEDYIIITNIIKADVQRISLSALSGRR
jgi:hypothetical protein